MESSSIWSYWKVLIDSQLEVLVSNAQPFYQGITDMGFAQEMVVEALRQVRKS